ncbi:D-amino acid dehydrogenase [Acinetobacter sp. ANC 3832]|uniref:D-amino acid dehydrogenase n=1 Tax=Acinetobacter sp. ANC 3832 TaxID=1977874 RepID=UPI000A351B75|nr:D-amino acid dehydrogenase [Acinetobacter sp. ANC 3832]OTG87814.1 D-amino acid dehydrogenase small subunit [Acinetobacter sp. ANC 3832]
MHIIVMGAGVIGTTSAYYLAQAGHEVTVIDRQAGVALETSFANAGQISPGYASPWAAPGIPLKAFKWMFQHHSPLAIKLTGDMFQYQWMVRMLAECNINRYQINKERMVRLSEYSRDCLDALRQETGIHFDERQLGTLQLFRKQQQLDAAEKDTAVLKEENVPYELLDKSGVIQAEPALAHATVDFVGGLRLPNDQTGDCQKFTVELSELAEKLGVHFMFNTHIKGIEQDGDKITGIILKDDTKVTGDAYVMATGSYSHEMLQQLNIDAPVYPLKGYSITTKIIDSQLAPVSTILDESYKIALTRFDDRIRVGGMAELTGFDRSLNTSREDTLLMVLQQLFPNASDISDAHFWTGLRPATPDGTPIVGKTKFKNLYTNTGHGTLGWTMSCGSAKLLSDIISGTKPQIEYDDLNVFRYDSVKH